MLVECSALHCIHICYIETGAFSGIAMSSLIVENTKIRDMMSHQPVTMLITSSASDIAKKMTGQKVGSILLIDHDNRPVGIVTERDLVRQACSQNLPLESVPAALLMSAPLVIVEASDNLRTAVELMAKHGIRHLAVKNKKIDKQIIGLLSVVDIIRHIGKQLILTESPSSIFTLLSSLHIE
jgi:signal-transduction protein with cAMP-binding, CBS, and nucleotidyltransferase domain